MAFEHERREALDLLRGIENGSMSISNLAHLAERADPALLHFLVTWLRERYGHGHPAAEGVLGRVVALTERSSAVKRMLREGRADPIVEWFESGHAYRDYDAESFVALVVEKLEG